MLIIGFGNKARHGKDTAAEAILDHYSAQNQRIAKMYGIRAPQTKVGVFKYATALYKEVETVFLNGGSYWEWLQYQTSQPIISFLERLPRKNFEECWSWAGKKNEKGYGIVYTPLKENYRAHRFMWEVLLRLSVPEGSLLRHKCDNQLCCNPSHLELGTPANNSKDMVDRGRSAYGESHSQAVLKDEQVEQIKVLAKNGVSQAELISQFNSSSATISRIINGKTRLVKEGVTFAKSNFSYPNFRTVVEANRLSFSSTLQYYGTEYRRKNFGENYWVDKMFASIPANLDVALISDTRFPNEADEIKQRGGYTVNVTRLREDGSQYYSSDRPVDHPSETALDNYNWDFRLMNHEGHRALLEEEAITLAEYLRGLNG